MQWLNEPPEWRDEDGVLSVATGARTDFWQRTHYGFQRDSGHFRHDEVAGDFVAELAFSGDYETLYDQAGMMLRIDASNWIKAGIEFVDGRQWLSVVVTREASDWSTAALPTPARWLRLRATREGDAVRIEWAVDAPDAAFEMLRLAFLPPSPSLLVGPMCCSPERGGFSARFRDVSVRPHGG